MDVFRLRDTIIDRYSDFVTSFVRIKDPVLRDFVDHHIECESLWPEPLIQLNPAFQNGGWIDELVAEGLLQKECSKIFRVKDLSKGIDMPLRLHKHQVDGLRKARERKNYVLTTGTGSGKSLAYIVPIVDHVLRTGAGRGVQAIVVYPMNALCNSQFGELRKFLHEGYPEGREPVRFAKYTGQESQDERQLIIDNPPDIILTNYVMLELLLTRPFEKKLIAASAGLSFLVLDELHTYRGRQGADVALLVRRVREACRSPQMLCVGTSATMSSAATPAMQKLQISEVASRLFGAEVTPEAVIGETLSRQMPPVDVISNATSLKENILADQPAIPKTYAEFISTPLAVWLESFFGLQTAADDSLVRSKPRAISGENSAAVELSSIAGVDAEVCGKAIRRWLMAGYACDPDPVTQRRPFAFRLHQFISRGDTVYGSLENDADRVLSLSGQQFASEDRERILLPMCFCRECGAAYYAVWKTDERGGIRFEARELNDRVDEPPHREAGFLYRDPANPWPQSDEEIVQRLPDDWLEDAGDKARIRQSLRDEKPQTMRISTAGELAATGLDFQYTRTPFRFCLGCGVSYRVRRGASDFAQLSTLASGGRSSATTILGLTAVQLLKQEPTLSDRAKKLLSFTDNRQDASLQAGHFNDFIEVSLLRAALFKAVSNSPDGIDHDELPLKVFRALDLEFGLYAREPGAEFALKNDTEKAFRNVLAYRLYRDLRRGWRIASPNLEQCGLLKIEYPSLADLCASQKHWSNTHGALLTASPATREQVARVLLDFMRRDLAIDVDFLTAEFFERLQQQSAQRLREPWAIDEQERGEFAGTVFPRARRKGEKQFCTFLSSRSGFGIFLKRLATFPDYPQGLKTKDQDQICRDLFAVLGNTGFMVAVTEPDEQGICGYRLSAAAMKWVKGDGEVAFHDPIRVPIPPAEGSATNSFFVNFYRTFAASLQGLEAREHTAQVPYAEREKREEQFSKAHLPVLFCSPTMELGVDISELNVVNMRNVPPTPANYAQRSGRAGRSGQPALVYTYCTTGSSHDQYFFRQPDRMVSGAVNPPRLDLANEDLVRAHVHAVWLAETGQWLGNSLTDLLDCEGEKPTLALLPSVLNGLTLSGTIQRAQKKCESIFETFGNELQKADWWHPDWLARTLSNVVTEFDKACDRWRSLFRAATSQLAYQNQIIADVAQRERWEEAKRIRREAEAQRELLTDVKNVSQSDFYSYRYFASEGFLPGYSFPRLPLSAFIPARRRSRGTDEFLSRPRFLAISEFGPRSLIYHEGSRYIVNKVILPAEERDALTMSAKHCQHCGYMHEIASGQNGPDLCESCGSTALLPITSLLRLQNVATKRRDRINSDEEERTRMGFEIRTGLRFKEINGQQRFSNASITLNDEPLFSLRYGDAARLWRINIGWKRRADRDQFGFVIDLEKGVWEKSDQLHDQDDTTDDLGPRRQRVVPFVEDRRNCLLLRPENRLDSGQMLSLQTALKKAVQAIYQLEDNELAAESLPSDLDRREILLYEASEGGAGVLRRLVDDGLTEVAREALRICHFDPDTGEDLRRAHGSREDCVAACYDCLMTYANQREHKELDRVAIKDLLMELSQTQMHVSPGPASPDAHFEQLKNRCDSQLERDWLDFVLARGLRLPSHAQTLPERAKKICSKIGTKPDFFYENASVAIYIDGPPHDFPERQTRDAIHVVSMEDKGILCIRFHHQANWASLTDQSPNVFGTPTPLTIRPQTAGSGQASSSHAMNPAHVTISQSTGEYLDMDLFEDRWHSLVKQLGAEPNLSYSVEPGGDISSKGRVVGQYSIELRTGGKSFFIIDSRLPDAAALLEAAKQNGLDAIAIDPMDTNALKSVLKAHGVHS